MVKLEVGKYYKTRDGQKVGPMKCYGVTIFGYQALKYEGNLWAMTDGKNYPNMTGRSYNYEKDIIAEWTEEPTGPVRTVTRKEIVPGVYGKVGVGETHGDVIWLGLRQPNGDYDLCSLMCAAELRAAIATLTEIADALEQK